MDSKYSGVSPVVGVMLMLAVTIMIAAIVSATAGNFSNTEKKAPSAILDVSIYAHKQYDDFSTPAMVIRHISGNVLQTKDLQIVTYYSVPGSSNISRGSIMGEKPVDVKESSGTTQLEYFSLKMTVDLRIRIVMQTGLEMHQHHSSRVTFW